MSQSECYDILGVLRKEVSFDYACQYCCYHQWLVMGGHGASDITTIANGIALTKT